MTPAKRTKKTCPNGHTFHKSSDCPTCPVREADRAPENGFLAAVGAPARRALEREGMTTLAELAKRSERDLLKLHGIGPSAIPKLRAALEAQNMSFKQS